MLCGEKKIQSFDVRANLCKVMAKRLIFVHDTMYTQRVHDYGHGSMIKQNCIEQNKVTRNFGLLIRNNFGYASIVLFHLKWKVTTWNNWSHSTGFAIDVRTRSVGSASAIKSALQLRYKFNERRWWSWWRFSCAVKYHISNDLSKYKL